MKRIAVLISVYNRKDKTLNCLTKLYSQKGIDSEYKLDVYLTNDGCTDGTAEAISELFPLVHIITGDGSLFWNRGMIEAWKAASKEDYDFYLWLNDDVELFGDAVIRLVTESSKHGDNAVVGGSMCYSSDHSKISYGGRLNRHHTITDVSKALRCKTLAGNLVLIPRYVYQTIGMNDPFYHHSGGDLDYTLRACEAGIEVWLAKSVFGICDREDQCPAWGDPSKTLKKRLTAMNSIKGCNPKASFYFDRKHYGLLNACYRYFLTFIHVLFPSIWMRR